MIERNGGLMSVIVKGMKMPKNCLHCDFDDSYGICACRNEAPYVCEYSAKQRPSWCPLEEVPSAQPETHDKHTETHSCDLISRQWLMECVNEGWIKFDTEKDENRFIHLVRDIAPSAQPDIIRCKDCKWKQGSECVRFAEVRPFPDDFCSRAERRTDE